MTSQTTDVVLNAAYSTFMALGYDKTTMTDIARAANVSRPTLYRSFDDKAQVFLAVVDGMHLRAHTRYEAAAAGDGSITGRLIAVGVSKVETVRRVAESSPHGPDLLDVNQRIAGSSAVAAHRRLEALIARLLSEADGDELNLSAAGLTPVIAARAVIALLDGWLVSLADESRGRRRQWRQDLSASIRVFVAGLEAR